MNNKIIKLKRHIKNIIVDGKPEIIYETVTTPLKQAEIQEEVKTVELPEFDQIQLTEQELEQRLEQSYQRGFTEGIEHQKQQMMQEYQQRFKLLEKFFTELKSTKQELLKAVENVVVKLALKIAHTILLQQPVLDSGQVLKIVQQAFKKLSSVEKSVVVRVNPDDKEVVDSYLKDNSNSLQEVEILEDTGINRGGCVVESNYSTIDASLETQYKEIERALLKELHREFND